MRPRFSSPVTHRSSAQPSCYNSDSSFLFISIFTQWSKVKRSGSTLDCWELKFFCHGSRLGFSYFCCLQCRFCLRSRCSSSWGSYSWGILSPSPSYSVTRLCIDRYIYIYIYFISLAVKAIQLSLYWYQKLTETLRK